jgi:hypothetical protein
MVEQKCLTSFFYVWTSNFPKTVAEEIVIGPDAEDHLIYARVHFCLSILFLWLMSVFMPLPCFFDYCCFVICFEIKKYESSNF